MPEYRIKIKYPFDTQYLYLTAKSATSCDYIVQRKYYHLIKDCDRYEIEENKPPFMDEWLAQVQMENDQRYADLIEENSYQESWLI